MKRIYGRNGPLHNSWDEVMTLWTIHMGIHHPDDPQPNWPLPADLDPKIENVEHRYFEPTREQELLRQISELRRAEHATDLELYEEKHSAARKTLFQ